MKDEKGIAKEVVDEIVELRQNYFKVYRFLYQILGLVRVASDDIYYARLPQLYQVPPDLLQDWDVSQKIVKLFVKALEEFNNTTLLKCLIYVNTINHESDSFLEGG